MFNVNPEKYYAALKSLSETVQLLISKQSTITELTSYPSGFEYAGEVSEIISNLSAIKASTSKIERKASETKDKLCNLDNAFAVAYYACASSEYSDFVGPLPESKRQYAEMNQEKYYDTLFKYCQDLDSQGILNQMPEEVQEWYKNAKYYKNEMTSLSYEQKALEEHLAEKPIDGSVTELETWEKERKRLQKAVEDREKELGIYENKWYEDIGQMIVKTGSAWEKGVTSAVNGEGFTDLGEAFLQTGATIYEVRESAKSGVNKIGEWVVDGVTAVGGTVGAGATWLFHDTWSDNDKAGVVMDAWLDEVRKDKVGESRTNFYENTKLGQWINENSNLKYDSAGSKSIQAATRFAAEIAIATGAELSTFGAATPLVTAMFAAEGIGQATESYAQTVDREHKESYNYGSVLLNEAIGGLGGAMKGRMYGKLGANTVRAISNPTIIKEGLGVLKEKGVKNIVLNDVKSKDFVIDTVMTTGQKGYEGFVEYNSTGTINWKKLGVSFIAELAYSRVLDNLMSNKVSDFFTKRNKMDDIMDDIKKVGEDAIHTAENVNFNKSSDVVEYFGDPDMYLHDLFDQKIRKNPNISLDEKRKLIDTYLYQGKYIEGPSDTLELRPKKYSREKMLDLLTLSENEKQVYDLLVKNYDLSIEGQWVKKLTEEEKRILRTYTKEMGFDLNNTIRTGVDTHGLEVDYSKAINVIDSAIEKQRGLIKDKITVYRGVDVDAFGLSDTRDIESLKKLTGTIFEDKAYQSCSVLKNQAYTKDVLLEIEVPPGSNGAYIEQFNGCEIKYRQAEFLLGRKTKLVFKDVIIEDGQTVIKAEVLNT